MANAFTIQIATPERVVLEREVTSLVAPAFDGYLGIMAHHAPLAAELKAGELVLTDPDGKQEALAVAGGFLAVSGNVATVLADAAEAAGEIDLARAEAAEARARERLARLRRPGGRQEVDEERARTALVRATNRLTVGRKRP
ncbi:MAG: ATP synthase F1 subunit epsilon [Armatimonadetes bacterium]|nr:ATP synthase F1 subunit epsilon [Armatimonadota bacterium]